MEPIKKSKCEIILDRKTTNDKKHKLNTSLKVVPNGMLESIENGVTIETLEQMVGKKFDIYKYGTQITVHGIFDKLENNYIGGYKNVIQNKNLSIGIKYNAIDYDKKSELFDLLKFSSDYQIVHDSNKFYIQKYERFKDKESALLKCENFTKECKNFDSSLFLGSYKVFMFEAYYGCYYGCLELRISSFYSKNLVALYENISGLNYAEQIDIFTKKVALEKSEMDRVALERKKAIEQEEEKLEKRIALWIEENPYPECLVKKENYKLKDGDVFCKIISRLGNFCYVYFIVSKSSSILVKNEIYPSGVISWKGIELCDSEKIGTFYIKK